MLTNIESNKQFRDRALQHYSAANKISSELFDKDLNIFALAAKSIAKYVDNRSQTNMRVMINRIIITHNIFGAFTVSGLLWKVDQQYWNTLNTALQYLNYINPIDDVNALDSQLINDLEQL